MRKILRKLGKVLSKKLGKRMRKVSARMFPPKIRALQLIHVLPQNLGAYEAYLGKHFKSSLSNAMSKAGKQCVLLLRENTWVKDRGGFEKGWRQKTNPAAGPTTLVFNKQKYAIFIELGRRPGAKFPPVNAMREWVRRQIRPPEEQVNSIAFLVGRKIHREGIAARPVMTDPGMQRMLSSKFYSYVREKLDETVQRQALAKAMRGGR